MAAVFATDFGVYFRLDFLSCFNEFRNGCMLLSDARREMAQVDGGECIPAIFDALASQLLPDALMQNVKRWMAVGIVSYCCDGMFVVCRGSTDVHAQSRENHFWAEMSPSKE